MSLKSLCVYLLSSSVGPLMRLFGYKKILHGYDGIATREVEEEEEEEEEEKKNMPSQCYMDVFIKAIAVIRCY